MSDSFLPFARPSISEEAVEDVVACLRSGWITTGPRVAAFTEALRVYLESPYVLPLASATAGLHLALLAMGLKSGDEVITTPLTFAATLNVIVLAGGTPVLVDIDPLTRNLDPDKVEAAITPKTRVILPVHFAGLPIDLDPVYMLAQQYGLRVLEDAAHSIGADYKGRKIGSFGDTQVFSFHPNKNMTTGEGGCVATRDEALAKKIALLRFHGMDREAWNRFGRSGTQDYAIVSPGYKYNMMDIQAALGVHQLAALDNFIERRTARVCHYQNIFQSWPQLELPGKPAFAHRHAWHLYAPLIREKSAGMNRDVFMQRMKENNIGTGLHYRAVHLYPYYRTQFGFHPGDFPLAEDVSERIVSLPLFPDMTDAEQNRVTEVMARLFEEQQ